MLTTSNVLFHQVGKEVGAERIERCPTPNDSPVFIEALADIVQVNFTFNIIEFVC
jgi:protoheme ferro-lyase